MTNKYAAYSESGSSNDYDNEETRFSPYTTIRGEFVRAFGSESQYGQSFGTVIENAELHDGALYYYPAKDRYKLISWKQITGFDPYEAYEEGIEIDADSANDTRVEDYGEGQQRYRLVAARVPRIEDEDGDVLIEEDSKRRDIIGEGEDAEYGDWEDMDGATIEMPPALTWWKGSTEYGPSAAAKAMFETVSFYGSESVVDENDLYNWLPDTSGEDILRDDLEGRRVEFFIVTRESENGYNYNVPIIEDVKTGERVTPTNDGSSAPTSGRNTDPTSGSNDEPDAVTEAKEADSGSYPEPIADFISSGRNLNMNQERAEKLLDELVSDPENALTEQMLADNGGREVVVQEVV